MSHKLLAAIIHIGDNFSSCCISLKHDMIPKTFNIDHKRLSFEIPNNILFNTKHEFEAFGYEAERKYLDTLSEGNENKWLYFRRFTVFADENIIIPCDLEIETFDKLFRMPLIKILSESVQYFKHELLKRIMPLQVVRENEILWVLVMSDQMHKSAKHLLVELCKNCGFEGDQYIIESQSDAVSLSCRKYLGPKPAKTYIVVDCSLMEIFKDVASEFPVSVGVLEGTTLLLHLQQLFFGLIDSEDWKNLILNFVDYADFFKELDIRLRMEYSIDRKVTLRVPLSLMESFQNASNALTHELELHIVQDKIRMKNTLLIEAMETCSKSFLSDLEYLIKENQSNKECKDMLIVGELSEFKLFKRVLERKFPEMKIDFLDVDVSVMHGASVIGHSPQLFFTSKVCSAQNFSRKMESAHIELHKRMYTLNYNGSNRSKSMRKKISEKDITTLPDPHRPVKIAERFTELFEADWPKCIEQLQNKGVHVELCIEIFFDIVTGSFDQCKNYFQAQLEQLVRLLNPQSPDMYIDKWEEGLSTSAQPNEIVVHITKLRRKVISEHIPIILKSLQNQIVTKFQLSEDQISQCKQFAWKCIENSYYMQTMEEPMYMYWRFYAGDFIDWSNLEVFGTHGVIIDKLIWPVIYLRKNGPVMSKGIVRAK